MNDSCVLVSDCDTVPLDVFLPELQLAFGSMPDEVLGNYVREVSIRFCDRTSTVQQVLPVDLQCGVADVLLEPLCGMRVVAILSHSTSDCCAPRYEGSARMPWRLGLCGAGSARFVPPRILQLSPAPSQDRESALWVRVSVAPDRDACEVPRELYQRYHEAIIAGVKAEMYLLKGQDWFDSGLAQKFETVFNNACTAANIDRLLNYHRGPIQVRSRHRLV